MPLDRRDALKSLGVSAAAGRTTFGAPGRNLKGLDQSGPLAELLA